VKNHLAAISAAKARARDTNSVASVDLGQYQIAFSRTGLYYLGVSEDTGDVRFDKRCMSDDKKFLGDQRDWDPIFVKPNPDPKNGSVHDDYGALHGVITVAGSSKCLSLKKHHAIMTPSCEGPDTCTLASNVIIKLFGSSMTVAGSVPVEGRARPPPYKGHEHFGFQDGISQPGPR
jgi:hypothetical protein